MKNKRILYVSYDGMTDPLGQSQVLPYLKGLSEQGYRFTLISCEKPHRFEKGRALIERITSESNIEWHPLPYHKNPPILSTMADLRRATKLGEKLHRKHPFDAVHCRGHMPGTVGLALKKKFPALKLINDIRGFWADEKVDAGAWNLKNPVYLAVYKYFKRVERDLILQSAQQICLTQKAKDEILRWKHVAPRPEDITIIPCCADIEHFSPVDGRDQAPALRTELGLTENAPMLGYLGSIGSWYMLDEMLDFFVEYRRKVPGAKFLFVTYDEHDRILRTAAEKGVAAEDIILRPGSRAEVPGLLALCQHSVFFIRASYSKMSSSPTKQGEIMAMGIPVACNIGVGDTDRIVSEYHSGVLVKDFTPEAYDAAIDELLRTNFDQSDIREGAKDFFSLDSGIGRYLKVYDKVFEEKPKQKAPLSAQASL